VDVRRVDLEGSEQSVPVVAQVGEGPIDGDGLQVLLDDGLDRGLVDALGSGRVKLLRGWVLVVAQEEDDFLSLARLQVDLDVMRPHRGPSMGDGVLRFALGDDEGGIPAAVRPEEGLPLSVEADDGRGAGEEGEVISALPVLGLVVDDAILDFYLAGVEVALEVGGVILGIPKAELDAGESGEIHRSLAAAGDVEPPDLPVGVKGDEVSDRGLDVAVGGTDDGVAQAVASGVVLKVAAGGLPGGRPELAALVVPQIDVTPALVEGDVVVAVPGQPSEARIAIEGVAAARVRDQSDVVAGAQVVDPGQGVSGRVMTYSLRSSSNVP